MDNIINLDMDKIESLNLSIHAYLCLKNSGINSVYDLLNYSTDSKTFHSLLRIRNLGNRVYEEIINKIHLYGFKFSNEEGYLEMLEEFQINRLFENNQYVLKK